MSLEFLKIHFLKPNSLQYSHQERGGTIIEHRQTLCGRWSPDWARRTTSDPDFVTCEPCLDVLVLEARRAIEELGMSTEEILEKRG